jgi:hypothetical protein
LEIEDMRLEWTPCVSLGPIRFGEPVAAYVRSLGLAFKEHDTSTEWDTYVLPGAETYVYAEDGSVIGVGCYDECWYRGHNLVGMSLREAAQLIGHADAGDGERYELDGGAQDVFEFPDLECQMWARSGTVATVYCLVRRTAVSA